MAESGVMMHADLSAELLASLFAPGYPLHDGAVIVSGDQIVAAGVMLPLAERDASMEQYGTRHRAALGVTEQTDAVAIVVSEESGVISLAVGSTIVRGLDEDDLRQRLYGLLAPGGVSGRARRLSRRRNGSDDAPPAAEPAPPTTAPPTTAPAPTGPAPGTASAAADSERE
jgi:diadenylate cyclase